MNRCLSRGSLQLREEENGMRKLLVKIGSLLCACAVTISPLVVEGCRVRYYQPKEPDGLKEFVQRR